jgi:hypothetical protein
LIHLAEVFMHSGTIAEYMMGWLPFVVWVHDLDVV